MDRVHALYTEDQGWCPDTMWQPEHHWERPLSIVVTKHCQIKSKTQSPSQQKTSKYCILSFLSLLSVYSILCKYSIYCSDIKAPKCNCWIILSACLVSVFISHITYTIYAMHLIYNLHLLYKIHAIKQVHILNHLSDHFQNGCYTFLLILCE